MNAESSQPHHPPSIPPAQPLTASKVEMKEDVPPTPQTPQNHHQQNLGQPQQTPDINTPQGVKNKAQLKGWSNLRLGDTPATPSLGTPMGQIPSQMKSRTVDTSNTFAAFQKAAKEKSERFEEVLGNSLLK